MSPDRRHICHIGRRAGEQMSSFRLPFSRLQIRAIHKHSKNSEFAFWKFTPHWFWEARQTWQLLKVIAIQVIESYCNSISLAKKFWISTGFLHIPLLFLRLTLRDRYHRGDARLTVVLLTAQFRTHQHASTPEAKSPHIWRAGERGDLGFAGAIQGIGKNSRVLFVHPTQACIMKCKLK